MVNNKKKTFNSPQVINGYPSDNNCIGMNDAPSYDDHIGASKYASKLNKFIMTCETPMTLSLQGGWGTGKTTLFQLMKKEMEKVTDNAPIPKIIEINTWQYAVAGYQDNLIMVVMLEILDKLGAKKDSELKKSIVSVFTTAAAGTVSFLVSDYLAEKIDNTVDKRVNKLSMPSYEVVNDIKKKFSEAIAANFQGENRLVVFIDDLDRLKPIKAVELLEGLKNFIECKNCIFVLAIDADVVYEGINEKFGKELHVDRKKRFFDKIIQVPYQLPVASYKINELVANCLESSGLESSLPDSESEKVKRYVNVINEIIRENNPRSIKRLLNLMTLQKLHFDENQINDENGYILFALVVFQSAYPEQYKKLIEEAINQQSEGDKQKAAIHSLFTENNVDLAKLDKAIGAGFENVDLGENEKLFDNFVGLITEIGFLSPPPKEKEEEYNPLQGLFNKICGAFEEVGEITGEPDETRSTVEYYRKDVKDSTHIAMVREGDSQINVSLYFDNKTEKKINPTEDVKINGQSCLSRNTDKDNEITYRITETSKNVYFTMFVRPDDSQEEMQLEIIREVIKIYGERWK